LQLQVANQAGSADCNGVVVPVASINLPFTIHHSPFTIHHSLFTISRSPLSTHHSSRITLLRETQAFPLAPSLSNNVADKLLTLHKHTALAVLLSLREKAF